MKYFTAVAHSEKAVPHPLNKSKAEAHLPTVAQRILRDTVILPCAMKVSEERDTGGNIQLSMGIEGFLQIWFLNPP